MATLTKRGNSYILSWQQGGKQHRKSLGVISKFDAKIALNAKELELATGQNFLPSGLIFSNFCAEYLDWFVVAHPNSYYRVEQIILQHLTPYFEFFPLDNIRIKDAEKYKSTRLKSGIKTSTVNKELITLKAILNRACKWEYLPSSGLKYLELAKELDSKPPRFYTAEEMELIYQWAPYNWHYWKLMANTGLRRTEASQLKWDNIKETEIHIESTEEERTKSGKWRKVPLNSNAKHALKRFERDRINEYVFPRVNKDSLTRAFKRVLNRAPINNPKGSVHCLRHTFCSHLVMNDVPLRTVQILAGHSKITVTEKYAHLAPEYLKNSVELINL